MKRSRVILSSIISIILGGLGVVSATSALEYQSNPVDIKFEFGSTLNITTGGNISISDLTPGTKAISASNYNVTVSTNNLTGYTLSATVGCSSGTDCYDSKNLSDGTNTFSMLSTDGALTAGTWGVSLDSSATANSNFKTLAKYDETATIINQTITETGTAATGYTGTTNTTVRVGAYATTSQVAGTYTNSINFIAVANAAPNCGRYLAEYCMQDINNWVSSLSAGQEVTVTDSRDGKRYYALKLSSGHMMMTQNLDHDIVAQADYYTPQNTDIPSAWTPSIATTTTTAWDTGETSYIVPQSYNPGEKYWNGTLDSNFTYTGTLNDDTYIDTSGDAHYHVGNYYNWTAAVAMNDSGTYTVYETDANQSICPAGWTIPTSRSGNGKITWNEINNEFDNVVWFESPLYYNLAGTWNGTSANVGAFASWYNRDIEGSKDAFQLRIVANGNKYNVYGYRNAGFAVRCVSR